MVHLSSAPNVEVPSGPEPGGPVGVFSVYHKRSICFAIDAANAGCTPLYEACELAREWMPLMLPLVVRCGCARWQHWSCAVCYACRRFLDAALTLTDGLIWLRRRLCAVCGGSIGLVPCVMPAAAFWIPR